MNIEDCRVFLFQGDSITDCGRDRSAEALPNHNQALGPGYASKIAGDLLADYPSRKLTIFNRGISGNRVVDLYARWKCDAVNLKPDCLSILIGVNDTWHEFGSQNGVELDRYEQVYRMLLQYTLKKLPKVNLVLCEPFVLATGVVTPEWEVEMAARREIVARLAKEFGTVFVPFQKMFNEAIKEAAPDYWTADGVHPTPAGNARMAKFWRECVGI
ncbi:MAG: SGNH/GDSL hydrolase family protein [Chthoniobacteraceae bacterium]|nr:SGNH/GDSL hydrolase family protein [Chthoniobacteraceae bacterium]